MAHKPLAVANEFVRQYGPQNRIDHLKLQKLTYFTQGWWLALTGAPLVTERPQVWRYGPVFKSLYQIFSPNGREPITQPKRLAPFIGVEILTLEGVDKERERACVEWIWNEYGALDGTKLSDLTHATGTPWRQLAVENKFEVPLNMEIPVEKDWAYFAALAKDRGFEPHQLAA